MLCECVDILMRASTLLSHVSTMSVCTPTQCYSDLSVPSHEQEVSSQTVWLGVLSALALVRMYGAWRQSLSNASK